MSVFNQDQFEIYYFGYNEITLLRLDNMFNIVVTIETKYKNLQILG